MPGAEANDEIGGGHFLFLLRDAVAATGRADRGQEAMQFYAKLAAEVNEACDRGELAAGPRRSSMLPPWDMRYLPALRDFFFKACKTVALLDGLKLELPSSMGNAQAIAPIREMTHSTIAVNDPPTMRLVGVAFSPDGPLDLRIVTAGGAMLPSALMWQESPGLYMSLKSRGQDVANATSQTSSRSRLPRPRAAGSPSWPTASCSPPFRWTARNGVSNSPALQLWVAKMEPESENFTEGAGLATAPCGHWSSPIGP